jgi:hypothetical protein
MNAKMPMADAPHIEKAAFSRKVRRVFGLDLHSWEQLMLLSLGIAGLIAIAVFVTTASVVILQRHETAEAKRQLDEYKIGADEKVAAAKAVGDTAQENAAKAIAETAKARERTAALENEAAQARAEQERLKAIVAWRRINAGQFETLQRILKGHPITVWVSSVGKDPEAMTFRSDIDRALQVTGLTTKFFSGWDFAVGLRITDTPAGADRDLLIAAFKEAGLPFGRASEGVMPNELTIIVGTKPPPF